MDQATYRKLKDLIEPCQSPDELDKFIVTHWNIRLPWDVLDEDSTSSPLAFVWGVYNTLLTGEGATRHVLAASRNGAKTLTSSMIQWFSMVHFRRDGAHVASTLNQSAQAIRYLDTFLVQNPMLAPYLHTDNTKIKELRNLPANDFSGRDNAKIQVITATKRGANAPRASCLDGRTTVVVLRPDGSVGSNGSRYEKMSIRGIHKRIQKGEEIFVSSVDAKTGEISDKKVLGAMKEINLDRIAITTKSGKTVHSTPDHWHASGYKNWELWYTQARDLEIGDCLLAKAGGNGHKTKTDRLFEQNHAYPHKDIPFNESLISLDDFVTGSLLGDGYIYLRKTKSDGSRLPYKGNAYFCMNKSTSVGGYMEMASRLLSQKYEKAQVYNDLRKSGYTGEYLLSIQCKAHKDMTALYKKWYPHRKKIVPRDLELTWGSFAVFLMDDGTKGFSRLSTHGFSREDNEFLCKKINELVGFDCARVGHETKRDRAMTYDVINLHWPYEHFDKLLKLQAYTHLDYKYKFDHKPRPCKHCRGMYYFPRNTVVCNEDECRFKEFANGVDYDEIVKIEHYKVAPNVRNRWVYDITVEDNHNFFANQIITRNCMTFDEVDLTPREILSEVAFVADPSIQYNTVPLEPESDDPYKWHATTGETKKHNPIFVYLSSRKSNSGPIQDLITEAEQPDAKKNGIKLHKWSSVDWMEKCEPEVHKPEGGRKEAFLHTETLKTIWGRKEFEALVPLAAMSQYKEISAYEGCMDCPAFIACQGRSVKQSSTSPMLRTRQFISDVLRAVKDTAAIIAQALNWRPETTGLVFKNFSYYQHVKDPIDFYKWVTFGKRFNPRDLPEAELDRIEEFGTVLELVEITPTKEDIYVAMLDEDWNITAGVDWGFNPDPAVCTIQGWHKKRKKLAILHMEAELNHANHVWARYVAQNIYPRFPFDFVGPDLADPASPGYFRKEKIRSLDTKPKRIETGVSFIRGLLWDPIKAESDFAILDDSQGEDNNIMLIEAMQHWTHAKDALGRWNMKKFADDQWTHTIDSLRYGTAPFVVQGTINTSAHQAPSAVNLTTAAALGSSEAKKIIEKKNEVLEQFKSHMMLEHGISNPLGKPKEILNPVDNTDEKSQKGSSGIKFRM